MVLEVVTYDILPGQEDAFESAYQSALPMLTESEGCRSVRLTRCTTSESRFILLIEWDSADAAITDFVDTYRFGIWRDKLRPFFAKPPVVEKCVDVR